MLKDITERHPHLRIWWLFCLWLGSVCVCVCVCVCVYVW